MQDYIGTKQIKALPMNRADYNDYRGWQLPDDEDGTDEGFLVEYVDGGQANHPDHEGYVSWSPKDVFERAYKQLPSLHGLEPHQVRVVIEHVELCEKLNKLTDFMATDLFAGLSDEAQFHLQLQMKTMESYERILTERTKNF